jgi:hypothetical protein
MPEHLVAVIALEGRRRIHLLPWPSPSPALGFFPNC